MSKTPKGFSPVSIYDVTKLNYCSYCFKCNSIPNVHRNKECDGCKEFVRRNPSYWSNGSEENFERIKLLTFVYIKCFVNGCTFETSRPHLIKKHLIRFHNREKVAAVEMLSSSFTPAAITNIKTEQVESLATSSSLPSVKKTSVSFDNLTSNSHRDKYSSSSSTGPKNKHNMIIQRIVPIIILIKQKIFPLTEHNPESCFQTPDNGTDSVNISSDASIGIIPSSSTGQLSGCNLGESSKVNFNGTLVPPLISDSALPSSPKDSSYISGQKNYMTDSTNFIPKQEYESDCSLNSWEEQKPKTLNRRCISMTPEGFSPVSVYDVTELNYCSYCFKCDSIPDVHRNKECDGCEEFVRRNPTYWSNGSEENFERVKLLTFVYVKCFVTGCTFQTDRPYLIKEHLVQFHNLSNSGGKETVVEKYSSSSNPVAITTVKEEQFECLTAPAYLQSVIDTPVGVDNLTNVKEKQSTIHNCPLLVDPGPPPSPLSKSKHIRGPYYGKLLLPFILKLLGDKDQKHVLCWTENSLEFRINNTVELARLWGIRKRNPLMTFDKLSRALRYYYEKNIIKRNHRLVYSFCNNSEDIREHFVQFPNISLSNSEEKESVAEKYSSSSNPVAITSSVKEEQFECLTTPPSLQSVIESPVGVDNLITNVKEKQSTIHKCPLSDDPPAYSLSTSKHIRRPHGIQLWQFILELLGDKDQKHVLCWTENSLEFRINDTVEVARLWGIRKRNPLMTFDKLSRAMRYYYERNIIKHNPKHRLLYTFCNNPELRIWFIEQSGKSPSYRT